MRFSSVPASEVAADDPRTVQLSEHHSPWGTFSPGNWAFYRTITQTFEKDSSVTSVKDTQLTLEAVKDRRVILKQKTSVNIGGQNFSPEPQQIICDFYRQRVEDSVKVEVLPLEFLSINRKQVVCQVCKYTYSTESWTQETTVWYSPQVMPYVLKTDLVRKSKSDGTILMQKTTAVTETSDLRPLGRLLRNYTTQSVMLAGKHTTVTNSYYSDNVPGGLLRETSVETDANKKVVSRTETTLYNYSLSCP
ncbi:MAG: hypothetical protein LBQ54_08195 [Planctomycetaceae bacterium]|nr:hypothetical protein [Planctomycetaceae bacterium]